MRDERRRRKEEDLVFAARGIVASLPIMIKPSSRRYGTSLSVTHMWGRPGGSRRLDRANQQNRRVGVLVILSGAVLVGRGPPLQPKSAGRCHATASWFSCYDP